jgi:hypothetical protein
MEKKQDESRRWKKRRRVSDLGGRREGAVSSSSTEVPSFLKFNEMSMVEPAFHHRRFFWMCKPYVSVVLTYSGLYRTASLSDVYLTTLTGYAVNPRSPQSQVALHCMKETGDLLRLQSYTLNITQNPGPLQQS